MEERPPHRKQYTKVLLGWGARIPPPPGSGITWGWSCTNIPDWKQGQNSITTPAARGCARLARILGRGGSFPPGAPLQPPSHAQDTFQTGPQHQQSLHRAAGSLTYVVIGETHGHEVLGRAEIVHLVTPDTEGGLSENTPTPAASRRCPQGLLGVATKPRGAPRTYSKSTRAKDCIRR